MIIDENLKKILGTVINNANSRGMLRNGATYRQLSKEFITFLLEKTKQISADKVNLYKSGKLPELTPESLVEIVKEELNPIRVEAKDKFEMEVSKYDNLKPLLNNELNFDKKFESELNSLLLSLASEFNEYQTKSKHEKDTLNTAKRANKISLSAFIVSFLALIVAACPLISSLLSHVSKINNGH